MSRVKTELKEKYLTISNSVFRDPQIGIDEIGMLAVMKLYPVKQWHFSVRSLSANVKDGKFKVASILKKLEKHNYLSRVQTRTEKGEYSYNECDIFNTNDKSNGYTCFNRDFVEDANLKIFDIGLLALMLSLPKDWNFSIEGLVKRFKGIGAIDGKGKIERSLKRLSSAGYFQRKMIIENGRIVRWEYTYSDIPNILTEETTTEREIKVSNTETEVKAAEKSVSEPENSLRNELRSQINYSCLISVYNSELVDWIVETLGEAVSSGRSYRVCGKTTSHDKVKGIVMSVTQNDIERFLNNLKSLSDVKSPIPFILTSILKNRKIPSDDVIKNKNNKKDCSFDIDKVYEIVSKSVPTL